MGELLTFKKLISEKRSSCLETKMGKILALKKFIYLNAPSLLYKTKLTDFRAWMIRWSLLNDQPSVKNHF